MTVVSERKDRADARRREQDTARHNRERFEALEARVRVLEKGTSLVDSFRGVHVVGQSYRRGELVRRVNSLWLCLQNTSHAPGVSAAWALVIKGDRVPGA